MKKGRLTWIIWACTAAVLIAAIILVWVRISEKESADNAAVDEQAANYYNRETDPAQEAKATAGSSEPAETPFSGLAILLDGENMTERTVSPGKGDGLRVHVFLDSYEIADLPFGEEHVLQIIQYAGQNTVRITKDAVFMEDADCRGRDCVGMGEVTRDNLETRVMFGFIICLPHRVTVEVREEQE